MTSETTKIKKGKASAKRNSEARREQNRLASRNYREKRKQKLALLNELLEPNIVPSVPDNAHVEPTLGQSGLGDSNPSQLQSWPLPNVLLDDPLLSIDPTQGLSGFDNNEKYLTQQTWGSLAHTTAPTAFTHPVFPESLPLTNLGDPFSLGNQDPWGHDTFGSQQQLLQFADEYSAGYVNHRPIEEVFEDSPESDHSSSGASSSNDSGALDDILVGVENLSIEQKRSLLRRLQQDTGRSTPSPPQHTVPQTPGQLQAIQFAKALYKTAHARPTLFPTSYTMEAGIFGAMFANCYALGMQGVDEIIRDEGCSVFSVTQDEGYNQSQLPLDVIPFKSFRENLITLLDRDPSIIDEGALCHDILAGGFTCWGAGRNIYDMGAGVPWDSRSWEPSIWFLVKYRMLAGDWNGELWKSARSWHSARGERIQTTEAIEIIDNSETARR
ncbi:hypothetical protein QYS62_005534 [Fusarium acuminatum]|uniref:BZIP domain-containing protein n=1 Tax=Fusarium acuminatum TaxID=5515 RepID=A0ABZ2WVP5_9HYPO